MEMSFTAATKCYYCLWQEVFVSTTTGRPAKLIRDAALYADVSRAQPPPSADVSSEVVNHRRRQQPRDAALRLVSRLWLHKHGEAHLAPPREIRDKV